MVWNNKLLEINKVYNKDCISENGMCLIDNESIDLILCDLPYNKQMGKWDSIIPFDSLWEEYKRIIKPKGAIVLFGSQPFTSLLVASNLKMFKYSLVWDKGKAGNIFVAKLKPLITHEDILVFSHGATANGSKRNMNYYPQMEQMDKSRNYYLASSGKSFQRDSHEKINYTTDKKYPKSIWYFYNSNQKEKIHPTQKPVELFEQLIKTYSNEGDLVLDNCMGSFTTAVACINTNRNYIGFENNNTYFELGQKRLENYILIKN